MTQSPDRPTLVAGVLASELPGDEVVLSTADQDRAIILNPVGAAVVELCDGCRGAAEIAQVLCSAFADADPAQVRSDVESVLQELSAAGLLRNS